MEQIVDRCALLKNLPPDCTKTIVRQVLQQAPQQGLDGKCDKLYRHAERDNDVRWIVLFKTKQDVRDCIHRGKWECTVEGRQYVVVPDYCSGCIIPDEWLEGTGSVTNGDYTDEDGDLEEVSFSFGELSSSYLMVTPKGSDRASEKNLVQSREGHKVVDVSEGREETPVEQERLKDAHESVNSHPVYHNTFENFNDTVHSRDQLFGSGEIGDGIAQQSSSSDSRILLSGVFTSLGKDGRKTKDYSNTLNASVRSEDLFGSGQEYDSLQFADQQGEDNKKVKDDIVSEAQNISTTESSFRKMQKSQSTTIDKDARKHSNSESDRGIVGLGTNSDSSGVTPTVKNDTSGDHIKEDRHKDSESKDTSESKPAIDAATTAVPIAINSQNNTVLEHDIRTDVHKIASSLANDVNQDKGKSESTPKSFNQEVFSQDKTALNRGVFEGRPQHTDERGNGKPFNNPMYDYGYRMQPTYPAYPPVMNPYVGHPYPGYPAMFPYTEQYHTPYPAYAMVQPGFEPHHAHERGMPNVVFVPLYMPHPGMPYHVPPCPETKTGQQSGQSVFYDVPVESNKEQSKQFDTSEYMRQHSALELHDQTAEQLSTDSPRKETTLIYDTPYQVTKRMVRNEPPTEEFIDNFSNLAEARNKGMAHENIGKSQNLGKFIEIKDEESEEGEKATEKRLYPMRKSSSSLSDHIYDEINNFSLESNNCQESESRPKTEAVHGKEYQKQPHTSTRHRVKSPSGRPLHPLPTTRGDTEYTNKPLKLQSSSSSSVSRKSESEDDGEANENQKFKGGRQILVKGLPGNVSKDVLELYFENKKIGGGNIAYTELNEKKHQALIEFESENAAKEVLTRAANGHKFSLQNCELEVLEYKPPEVDLLKVLVQNVARTTTVECIVNFMEARCSVTTVDVVNGKTPGTFMLCFRSPPDVRKIQKLCENRKCEGNYWKVSHVERSRSVRVTGLAAQSSRESVSLYFENQRRSDGGDVEDVRFRDDHLDCIVTFSLPEDAERVCAKEEHVINGQTLDVSLYYPCLELDEDFRIDIPPPMLIEEDEHKIKFLKNSVKYKAMIENGIASQYGRVMWDDPTCITIKCIFDSKDPKGLEELRDWSEQCKHTVKDICDTLSVEKSINIAVEVWPEFKIRLGEVSVPDPQLLAVILSEKECTVVVVGDKHNVRTVFEQIEKIVTEVQDKIKKENQVITQRLKIKKYECHLLRASKMEQKFAKVLDEFSLNENGDVICKGRQKDVDDCLSKLRTTLNGFISRKVPGFTKEAKDLLFQKDARDYIKAKFNQEKLLGIWDIPSASDVVMYSKTEKDVDRAVNILQFSVKIESLPLDTVQAEAVQSEEGRKHLEDLQKTHEGMFLFHIQRNELRYACTDNILGEVQSDITTFLDLNTIISDFVNTDIGPFTFVVQYKQKQLESIENQYKRLSVHIQTFDTGERKGFKVTGKKDGCKLAIKRLQELVDSVTHRDHKIAWPGFDKYVKSKEGTAEIHAIEVAEKCIVKVFIPDSRSSQDVSEITTASNTFDREDRASSTKVLEKTLFLGSLASEKVDVIVNSTNSNLDLSVGHVSRSLLKAGGDKLAEECKRKYPDGIGVGEIAVTSCGAMHCKELFHGVLAKWDGGEGHAEKVMVHFIRGCLKFASAKHYESIAFPALGTGALGFPADLVAQLMNAVVDDFEVDNPDTTLRNVRFVVWEGDATTAKAFQDAQSVARKRNRHSAKDLRRRYITATEDIIVKGDHLITTIDAVKVEILKGDLTKEHTDAIVNSTTEDLNLNAGAISKAIVEAAGPVVQREAVMKRKEFDAEGLVVTGAGALMCGKIIHVRARNGMKGWTETIIKCLETTEKLGLNSVAFPALGTGGKGVSPDSMARIMIESFREYIQASSKMKGCLKSVRIVIFDDRMLESFISEVKKSMDPSQKKSFLQELKFWEKKAPEDLVPNTIVHVYGDSKFHVDKAVEKVEAMRREEKIYVTELIRDHISKDNEKHLRQIGIKYNVKVLVEKSGEWKILGYGKAVEAAAQVAKEYREEVRKDILDKSAASIKLPATWKGMKMTDATQVVVLKQSDPEYKSVYQKFQAEGGPAQGIIKIERIQNPTLYMQYIGKKCQMEQINAGGRPVEQRLWHGTRTRLAVDNIIQKGFDRNYNSGASYGVGVYFGVAAATSLGYSQMTPTGERYMLLADVLTGEYCAARGAIRVPPARSGSLTYDSTTDNIASPGLFVIYHDAQAYPTYLVTFK